MFIKFVMFIMEILTGAAEGEASKSDLAVRAPMTVAASMAVSCNSKLSSVTSNVRKVTLAVPMLVLVLVQDTQKRDATGTLIPGSNYSRHRATKENTYENGQHMEQFKFGIQAPGILLRLQRETDLFLYHQYDSSPEDHFYHVPVSPQQNG